MAAALPNAIMGSALAILSRGNMQRGSTILISGATGVTGRVAVQLAKHYGAAKIIVTGRNTASLEKLRALGADEIISLQQENEAIGEQLDALHKEMPIDLVIDYLWGHPIELILNALLRGHDSAAPRPVRVVTVGDMAGGYIELPSVLLRSAPIETLSSGIGSLLPADLAAFSTKVLPELFQLAATGGLEIEMQVEQLSDIETVWNKKVEAGKRLVVQVGNSG